MTARQATISKCGFNGSPSARHPGHTVECRILRTGQDTFEVLSSGSTTTRRVKLSRDGWSCTCPRSKYRKYHCKHIYAVEAKMLLPPVDPGKRTVLDPVPEGTCPNCRSTDCKKVGVRKNKHYANQRYVCRKCSKGFSSNLGCEKLSGPPDIVAYAINQYCDGMPISGVCKSLKDRYGWTPSRQTVRNWVGSRADEVEALARSLKPCLSEKSRADGILLKLRGETRYQHNMMDDATRYWMASTITVRKDTDDVSPMLEEGQKVAGKIPTAFVTDGDRTYHDAWKRLWRQRNFSWKKTVHHRHIHARHDSNNNAMESFNNVIRFMFAPRRGFNDPDSGLIKALRIHYNHARPHGGLDGATPGEAAGITVNGYKWLTLIQHARLLGAELAS